MRAESCGDCQFFDRGTAGKQPVCRQRPPLTVPLIVPAQPTPMNPQGIGVKYFTAWPTPEATDWCAQFERVSRLHLPS